MTRNPMQKDRKNNRPQLATTMNNVGADKPEDNVENNTANNTEGTESAETRENLAETGTIENAESKGKSTEVVAPEVTDAEQEEQESSKTDLKALVKGVVKNQPEERVPHTVYLKKTISDAFLKLGKDGGKGAKSTLINQLLEIALADIIEEQANKKNKK